MTLAMNIGLAALAVLPALGVPSATATAVLEPAEIPFYRQTRLRVEVEVPADAQVRFEEASALPSGLSVWGRPYVADTRVSSDRRRVRYTRVIEAAAPGDYLVPPATVLVNGSVLAQAALALHVRDVTEEEKAALQHFMPDAAPLDPGKSRLWVWVALCAAAALGAAAAVVWRHRGTAATPPRVAPPMTPWDEAYARLRALAQRGLPESGAFDPYYVELSGIVRRYIEQRFGLRAGEQTTPEFLAVAAVSPGMAGAHRALLATLLHHCDRVKFAGYEPSLDQMCQSLETVIRFVDETRLVTAPAGTGGAQ